ncbi:four-carbon acid sugar kinase family protein [Flaviflexus ciconiae]|uniref:3-oxo-tetronate kinase n=1 Tax=Flaviflexus ciconiae TaxID=2496867 RepID=A0A3Q9G8Q0_9ACTO|nr:3-oxo-tetronate kinase [Flaviflexus ciconiae]AZQ78256.1 four-carbon acid sugar kinase family protein [Flaviflexus ciconiae]
MRGALADDFTGATDLAGNWRARGLRTAVALTIPSRDQFAELAGYDAVVIAQKIRSVDQAKARAVAVRAGQALMDLGCTQIYDKYCSTFDSTPEGNIGPIAEELMNLTGASRAIVVPSFPDAGRTVYSGHLFVLGEPLDESPMKDHPLNPMRDSSVVRLMQAQTERPVGHVSHSVVQQGPEALRKELDRLDPTYDFIVVDAIDNEDLKVIAVATSSDSLVTGGSGIALGLPHVDRNLGQVKQVPGKRLILSGSASSMTRRQVQSAKKHLPSRKVAPGALVGDFDATVGDCVSWVQSQWELNPDISPLVYSVENDEDLRESTKYGDQVSALLEEFFGNVAQSLSDVGATQFIIAGGETSGAVCQSLGVQLLELGRQLAPGVSWLLSKAENQQFNMVLKSGNFGGENLFTAAWEELND